MRIADQMLSWTEGKIFVIDDSFEHEVWMNGDGIRLVLLIDFWHPDLSDGQKQNLSKLPNASAENRSTIFNVVGKIDKQPKK